MRLTERKQVFGKELFDMKQDGFITQETYDDISKSSNKYYASKIGQFNNLNPSIQKQNMQKKVQNEQETTERKTSMLLNLGVLFLFLSGLIFATTNWNSMELIGKVSAVIFMGAILAVGSYIADSRLSLKKTAYALWILMTLYIPIVGITFIYSLLWDKGVNITEPRSLISMACLSLVSSLVNCLSACKYKSKFYVWATYTTLELALLFFTGSLKIGFSGILFVLILSNLAIIYSYLKIKVEPYKLYSGKYLKIFSYIVLTIALVINFNTLDVAYVCAIILLFPALFITSRLLKDKCVEIFAILYLFVKSIILVNVNNLNMTTLVIPAIILYLIYYYDYKIKIHKETGYISLIFAFVLFNMSALSNGILFSIGVISIMITGGIIYKKKQSVIIKKINIKTLYETLLPIYTYILLVRTPFILIKNLSDLQSIFIICITSVILSLIQLVIKNKYENTKLSYSKISVIILIVCGLISITHIETMILMIISLAVFQVIGIYRQFNKASIIINLVIGINIILKVAVCYNQSWQCVSMIVILGLFLGLSRLTKQDKNLLIFVSALFLFACTILLSISITIEWVALILGVLMTVYTLKTERVRSLLTSVLSIGINILLLSVSLLSFEYQINQIMIVLIMTLYAVIISALGSVYFKEFMSENKYDSLTIAGIMILSVFSILSYSEYWYIAITTVGSLALIGFNIKKLKESTVLKLFITLRLLLTYAQVLSMLDISLNGELTVIPILIWAIASRHWIFKNKKIGEAFETISLWLLNIKSLLFIFNVNLLHSIIIITIGIIVFIISYSKKSKSYFITSLIMIIPLFIRSTFDFWIIVPWWLYMLVFGIILITLGSLAEKKGKKLKDIKNNFFKDWQ